MIGPGGTICARGLKYTTNNKAYKHKRRLKRTNDISVSFESSVDGTTQIPTELVFHFSWPFLNQSEKTILCLAAPVMSNYAKLRYEASQLTRWNIKRILHPLDYTEERTTICNDRSKDVAKLLLLCDFDVGKLIRLLQGPYTGDFLDLPKIDETLKTLEEIPLKEGEPLHNYNLIHKIFHEGAPLSGNYKCDRQDMLLRNLYNNHPASREHSISIEEKIATDVQHSYAIAFPRWSLRFINGLFLAAMGWVTRIKNGINKGRQVNDPSTPILGPLDTGAINDHIPKHMCPEVYYQTTFIRALTRTHNLRILYPHEDIIQYRDDMVKAFKRNRYNPDASCAHAFAFNDFLIIPIGLVFGARDSPGLFCQVSEIRAFASQHFSSLGLPIPDRTLIDSVEFSSPPPSPEDITQAIPDSKNKGVDGSEVGPQNTFVDDNIMIELRGLIHSAALYSYLTALLYIGSPPFVENPISMEKFEKYFSHINELLGFVMNTRTMTITYPDDKRSDLLYLLSQEEWKTGNTYGIRTLASILGKLRNLGQILPFGVHLSINLQLSISSYVKKHLSFGCVTQKTSMRSTLRKIWDPYTKIHISKQAISDLAFLKQLLTTAPDSIWSRPISLVIPRDPHFTSKSDACNTALGGWCIPLNFQWRDLFINIFHQWDVHINIKEFIALFINTYFMMITFTEISTLSLLPKEQQDLDGYIFHLFTDNTSAISWMNHSSRYHDDPVITRLSHSLSLLIYLFNENSPSNFIPQHIPGDENGEADALSRPQIFPTYGDVFNAYPILTQLEPKRLPSKLKSFLQELILNRLTGEQIVKKTKDLLKVDASSLKHTAKNWTSNVLASKHCQPPTRKAS
jgi:hypothetical protein